MRIDTFKFEELNYFSKLLSDYTSNRLPEHLKLPFDLGNSGIEQQLVSTYPLRIERAVLADVITNQYQNIEISDAVSNNIQLLKEEQTYTVVTAHQLSLLAGPLYYVIKIANVIAYTRKLKQDFPQASFVPVYWMGSEDHDFDEVNHIHLFGKKITWETEQVGPVGRFSLENIEQVIQQVTEILGDAHPDGILELIKKAYSHSNVEKASRELVNGLFGKYGLVIVDGDDRVLKRAFAEVLHQEITEQPSFPLLEERSEALKAAGYHAQAIGRPVNLFHLGDTYRRRISPVGQDFEIDQIAWSKERLLEELRDFPENFSPNVILRPLFQQSVLPNIAFIGGGGEMAYWMQLPLVFDFYQVRFPVLIPRTSLMMVNYGAYQKLQKLQLEISDVFKDKDLLKKEYLLAHSEHSPSLEEEKLAINQILEKVKEKAAEIDKTLGPAAGADAQKILSTLDQVEGKMMRAVKQKNETSLKQIDTVYQNFFPGHSLQERHDNFLNFYSKYGQDFIEWLVQYLAVIEQEFVVMIETEKAQ